MKHWLCLILSTILLFSVLSAAVCASNLQTQAEAYPSERYLDVPPETNWAHEGIDYAIANGLLRGTGENVFSPNMAVTREMMAAVLFRMESISEWKYEAYYEDVPAGKWYTDAVVWAKDQEVAFGYENGRFGVGDTLTREQLAVMLYRYTGSCLAVNTKTDEDLSSYADAAQISGWASDAVKWAVAYGLLQGTNPSTLSPKGIATRAQLATILLRYDALLDRLEGPDPATAEGVMRVHDDPNNIVYALREDDAQMLAELFSLSEWKNTAFVEQTPTYTIELNHTTYLIACENGKPAYPGYSYITSDGKYGGKIAQRDEDRDNIVKIINICENISDSVPCVSGAAPSTNDGEHLCVRYYARSAANQEIRLRSVPIASNSLRYGKAWRCVDNLKDYRALAEEINTLRWPGRRGSLPDPMALDEGFFTAHNLLVVNAQSFGDPQYDVRLRSLQLKDQTVAVRLEEKTSSYLTGDATGFLFLITVPKDTTMLVGLGT